MDTAFVPGSIIQCRGREWIVLNGSTSTDLIVRPASGSEQDITRIYVPLEKDEPKPATFNLPDVSQIGNHRKALLLRDALMLSLRRGAGPFRSFAQIAVEPRVYQLVPLMMALKQETIRLLIADGVGIGKTIEAGLILREMLDRGEIQRFTVICPPHLIEQWQSELKTHFNIDAVAVTSSHARKLEQNLQADQSIFSAYPYTIVSIDYIKIEEHSHKFLKDCPEFCIIDEAHACVSQGRGNHVRYKLIKELSDDPSRHLILLTATPHSGNKDAFANLLALLKPEFGDINDLLDKPNQLKTLREQSLSQHIVQRMREDVVKWDTGATRAFPKLYKDITRDVHYLLKSKSREFYNDVLNYCLGCVQAAGKDEGKRHKSAFGTLAIMRCVSSSPKAALRALKTRAGIEDYDVELNEKRTFDADADFDMVDDIEPTAIDDPVLDQLIREAQNLIDNSSHEQYKDFKYEALCKRIEQLLEHDFRPIVFCRYIATAEYLYEKLLAKYKRKYKGKEVVLKCVTGNLPPEERKKCIEELEIAYDEGQIPILIATDCLSEGINLQNAFNAVVHYDLSWNPTRHEQRDGRVDRFGQKSEFVHSSMVYGTNNAIDMSVIKVILEKAKTIKDSLGITISTPDDSKSIVNSLMSHVFSDKSESSDRARQLKLFDDFHDDSDLEEYWKIEEEKTKQIRSIFAQNALNPEEVLGEYEKTLKIMGTQEDVQWFTKNILTELCSTPMPIFQSGTCYQVPVESISEQDVRERLENEGIGGRTLNIDFDFPGHPRCLSLHRSHPVVAILADATLEKTLTAIQDERTALNLGRVGTWVIEGIKSVTTIALLRIRYRLTVIDKSFLVEEACTIGWNKKGDILNSEGALRLLKQDPIELRGKNEALEELLKRSRKYIQKALDELETKKQFISDFATQRAKILEDDHRRIRKASNPKRRSDGRYVTYSVSPLPVDIIGLYVLLPKI